MLALQRAAARPAAFLDARRASRTEVAPARAAAAPRSRAVTRAPARLRLNAVAGAAVVCAASDDNAAEAQKWIAAWRQAAEQAGGQPVAAKAAAASSKASAVQAKAAGSAAGSSAGGASAQQWAHFAVAMAAFLAADRGLMAFASSNGISFPPPLLGMFALIAALSATEAAMGTPAVDAAAAAAAPAVDWIGRWLPLFYVPSLVVLPLALKALPGALVAKVLGLLVVGWAATLVLAAVATVQIRKVTNVELLPAPPVAKSAGFSDAHRAGWAAVAAASLLTAAVAPPEVAAMAGNAFMLASTVGGFLAGSAAPAAFQKIVHPLIACALAANAGALLLGAVSGAGWEGVLTSYLTKGKYGAPWGAGDALMAFLHSVILSFGFRVFAQRALMKRHFAEIVGCVVSSSIFGMFFTAAAGNALGLPAQLSLALAPRSVTVALALPIAALLGSGADASVTAATVVLTGLIGANFAQPLLTALRFQDPVVRGLSTAASAHGLGTAALAAKEPEALPVAALAYATMGIVSSLLVAVPQFRALLAAVAGA